jgi:predicted aspartyl protease
MKLQLKYGIPFTEVTFMNNDKEVVSQNVVIDTGSASTIISTETALQLDLESQLTDILQRVRGVGGYEFVYEKTVNCIEINNTKVKNLNIQIGAMNYGFEIDAILGMDFLKAGKLIIDCDRLEIIPTGKG